MKVAINGFGRIGRLLYRAALETKTDIDFAVVNDLTDAKTLAHLLKHDTTHGPLPFDVTVKNGNIIVDGQKLTVLAQRDPAIHSLLCKITMETNGRLSGRRINRKIPKKRRRSKTPASRSQKSTSLSSNEPS